MVFNAVLVETDTQIFVLLHDCSVQTLVVHPSGVWRLPRVVVSHFLCLSGVDM